MIFSKKHITKAILAATLVAVFGLSRTAKAETIFEGFDNFSASYSSLTLPDGWDYSGTASTFSRGTDTGTYKTSKPSICVEGTNSSSYLITPMLQGDFNFWIRNYTKNYAITVEAYACTFENGTLNLGSKIGEKTVAKTSSTPSWVNVALNSSTATRVAILITKGYFDDFTYSPAEKAEGATLVVTDFENGSTYDFGGVPVPEGTTKSFTLMNVGGEPLEITSIDVTGGFTITEGGSLESIAAGETAQVTVSTPASDAQGILTVVSNDPASPYLINLSSTYKVPRPNMTVDMTSINFGKVTANATQQVTVGNMGDASLNVTIASNSDDFTVSPASLTVEPEQTSTFTVTYIYKEDDYGVHNGKITLTPNYGDPAEIAVSAKVQDPTIWSEDFESNSLPEGWETTGSNWTISDGVAHGKYKYGARDELTTPALIVQEGEELTFDYKSTGYAVNIEMLISKDGEDFKAYKKESIPNNMSAFETYTISGLEAGSYRLRFINDDYDLDNFEGFHLNNNAPELAVTPDEDADFGKVFSKPEAKTYTVYNTGTGLMTVNIASSSDEFTVSPTVLTDISKEEPQTFTVSFNYNVENPGQKSSVISIVPTYNEEMAVTFNATALAKDPSVWTEDFTGNVLPEGWEATGSHWTFSDGVAHGKYQPYNQDYLITPSLTVAEGDKMSFNYKSTGYNVDIKVSYKKDYDKEYKDLVTISPDNYMQEFATYTIEGLDPGNYRFRFLSENYDLDEFDGLRLNLNAPELNVIPFDVADFGKVKAVPEAKVYTVTNIGTGLLSVNISSDSEDFTVEPSSLTDIEKGDSKTFKVMFNFDPTNLGEKKGVISVTPTYDEASAITFEAKALAKDPNIWEEDFEAGIIPDSWTNEGWTVENPHTGNGTYMAYSGMNGEATLITPRLHAQKDQELHFFVGNGTDDMDKLTVEYSHDLNTWTPLADSPMESGGNKTFVAPKDGYYYLKFQGKYASLDDFNGFRLAPKTHDVVIVEQNVPENGHQYTIYTVSVTVKETMGNDEEVKASLYIADELMAQSDVISLSAMGEETISLSFEALQPVNEANVVVLLTYSEEEVASSPVALTIVEAPVLDEMSGFAPSADVLLAAELIYTPVEGWNTITLPFNADEELLTQLFGAGYVLFRMQDYTDGILSFKESDNVVAGYPYVVYCKEVPVIDDRIILRDIEIGALSENSDESNGILFQATYMPVNTDETAGIHILTNNEELESENSYIVPTLVETSEETSLKAFRGHFILNSSTDGSLPELRFYDSYGSLVSAGVEGINFDSLLNNGIYDLNGIRVTNPSRPGIYIINGKKQIIK